MGALFAYLLARMTAVLKRTAVVYAILAAGGLLGIFAGGYALDALRAALSFRYGPPTGSLIVAGILAAIAAVAFAAALLMRGRPRPEVTVAKSSPYSTPPTRRPYSREGLTALASATAGALCVGIAIYKSPRLRGWLSGARRP